MIGYKVYRIIDRYWQMYWQMYWQIFTDILTDIWLRGLQRCWFILYDHITAHGAENIKSLHSI